MNIIIEEYDFHLTLKFRIQTQLICNTSKLLDYLKK